MTELPPPAPRGQPSVADDGAIAGRFESVPGFLEAMLQALDAAAASRARTVWLTDPDFDGWPLDDPRLTAALTHWVQQSRGHLILLATDDRLVSVHRPRFMAWRRTWGHAVDARCLVPDSGLSPPSLCLVAGVVGLRLKDRETASGVVERDPRHLHGWRLELDAFLQRAEPAFQQSTLGL